MRKLFILVLSVFLSLGSFAQRCQGIDSNGISPRPDSVAIFTPSSDALPCIVRDQPVSDTLYFTVFNRLHGFAVDSMTIDSINNLPPGMCWLSNASSNTFAGGQNGVIYLEGQTYGSAGQYKMQVFVQVYTSVTTIPFSTLESIAGLRYYLKVICPGGACPAVDTAGGVDSLYIPYSDQVCGVGIHEVSNGISDMSVSPNPFANNAVVNFASRTEGRFTLSIYDLLGNILSSKEINAINGNNTVQMDRAGLSNGMYILSLSDGRSATTQKIILE